MEEHSRSTSQNLTWGMRNLYEVYNFRHFDKKELESLQLHDVEKAWGLTSNNLKGLANNFYNCIKVSVQILLEKNYIDFYEAMEKYVEKAQDEIDLVAFLVNTFPIPFRDTCIYKGREIWLLKKAQLAIADIYRHCYGKDPLISSDKINLKKYIEHMSIFADNVVIAVMRLLGAVYIRDDLASKISKLEQLTPGSIEEVELRALSVSVGDELIARLKSKGNQSLMYIYTN